MKSFIAPLLEALIKHRESMKAGFHVPGHHYGQALQAMQHLNIRSDPAKYFSAIMELDVTELDSTDDLHHPEASIKEAQLLAASCFQSEETYFLVGGSTAGNMALILTICDQNDIVIVQRNVHKSIINGLKLAGAKAVFVTPEHEPKSGLATVPSIIYVQQALEKYPHAKALILSTPNYYGINTPMKSYAELAHRYDIPLIVDEAHGAHYGLHPQFPTSALAAGADAVVQSAHKTLAAMTMGAMLQIQNSRINRAELRQTLSMIQSSSPSFPIMASLDISRAMIDALGEEMFEQSLKQASMLRQWLKDSQTALQLLEPQDHNYTYDPLRIMLYDQSGTLTGFDIQQRLQEQGCWIEMADPIYAVLVIGIQTSEEDVEKLQAAIHSIQSIAIPGKRDVLHSLNCNLSRDNMISEPVAFTRKPFKNKKSITVDLGKSEHLISAEMVVPYPPGIPVLYEGERITKAVIEQCERLSKAGARFQGSKNGVMDKIEVYEEKPDT